MENKNNEPKSLFNLANKSVIENDIDISCLEHTILKNIKKYCPNCNLELCYLTLWNNKKKYYYCNRGCFYSYFLFTKRSRNFHFLYDHSINSNRIRLCVGDIKIFYCSDKECPEKCYVCVDKDWNFHGRPHSYVYKLHNDCNKFIKHGFRVDVYDSNDKNDTIYETGYCPKHLRQNCFKINSQHQDQIDAFFSSVLRKTNFCEYSF